jgi:hypothetical protein
MTVATLIEKLKTMPQELPVGTRDFGAVNGVYVSERKPNSPDEPTKVVYLTNFHTSV